MVFSRRNLLKALGTGIAVGSLPGGLPAIAQTVQPEQAHPEHETGLVLLNQNENAYGPSPKVRARLLEALAGAGRYPASREALCARIATMHGVKPGCVLLGAGSTEIIRVLVAGFVRPGKVVITAEPTFQGIAECALSCGGKVIPVPLNHEFSHDLKAMLLHVDSSTALVYICNPNNPTASITPRKSIDEFLRSLPARVLVVVDEAYHDFAPHSSTYASCLDQPVTDERLVVLRTFSMGYALAGLRVGYAVTSPDLASRMRPQLTERGISEVGLQGALASLDDEEGLRLSVKRNADDRQEFFNQAMLRMLKPIDSKTNFVMMDVHHQATEVIEHFRKHNVLIGPFFPSMKTHIRVSLGSPKDMAEFWRVWDLLPYSHGMRM